MSNRKIFAVIWRLNAIVILVAGLSAAVVLAVSGFLLIRSGMGTRHSDGGAPAALGERQAILLELGTFSPIPGSPVLKAPLEENRTHSPGYSSSGGDATRNILFFDPATRSATWLRPTANNLILNTIALPEKEDARKAPNTVVFVYVIVDRDSNGDGRLTEADTKQIAISAPNGTGFRVLVSQADRLQGATLLPSGRLLILTTLGKTLTASELEAKDPTAPVSRHAVKSL